MSLRFAASRTGNDAVVARMLAHPIRRAPANDNGNAPSAPPGEERLLRAALLHFARFGLGAAAAAHGEAQAAQARGDDQAFDLWLSVCRQFDRRLARGLEGKVTQRR